jgi:hypothetical protein
MYYIAEGKKLLHTKVSDISETCIITQYDIFYASRFR